MNFRSTRSAESAGRSLARVLASVVILTVSLVGIAHAEDRESSVFNGLVDYSTESEAWNGLSGFRQIASSKGWVLRETPDAVSPNGVIALFYPTVEFDTFRLIKWVEAGGNLLIADDFGASWQLVRRLGLHREPTPSGSQADIVRYGIVTLSETRAHPLSADVRNVMLNNPAVLSRDERGLFAFSEGGYFLYDLEFGRGRVIVVSDPSAWINGMLPAADNAQLAANVAANLCPAQSCDARVLVRREAEQLNRATFFEDADETEPEWEWRSTARTVIESFADYELDAQAERVLRFVLTMLLFGIWLLGFYRRDEQRHTVSPTQAWRRDPYELLRKRLAVSDEARQSGEVSAQTVRLLGTFLVSELAREHGGSSSNPGECFARAGDTLPAEKRKLAGSLYQRLAPYLADATSDGGLDRRREKQAQRMRVRDYERLVDDTVDLLGHLRLMEGPR